MMSPNAVLIGFTLVTCVFFNGVTAEGEDPFMLLLCGTKVSVSPLDFPEGFTDTNFQTIAEDAYAGVTYDPIGGHVYYGNGQNIIKMNKDGSNPETFWTEALFADGVRSISLGPKNELLYWTTYSNKLRAMPLNKATGPKDIVLTGSITQAAFFKSRLYIADSDSSGTLNSYNQNGTSCDSGTYENIQQSIGHVAFDEADGKLYVTTKGSDALAIVSRDAGDFAGDTEVPFLDDSLYGLPLFSNSDISIYGDWIYITLDGEAMVRYPKTGGGAVVLEFLKDSSGSPTVITTCSSVHIYPGGGEGVGYGNRMRVPVKQRRSFFGGFIADLDFKVGGVNAQWSRIEVVFPRRVFDLKIVGCDVRIQRKETTSGGRVMTTFTIVPESSDAAQGEARISMIGKIWRKRQGIKAPIIADVYYNYDYDYDNDCQPEP